MTHTLVIMLEGFRFPYHVVYTDNAETYLTNIKQAQGYWARPIRKAKVLYAFKGDHVKRIRRMGINSFVEIMKCEDVIIPVGINLLS